MASLLYTNNEQVNWYHVLDNIAFSFRGSQDQYPSKIPFKMMFGRQITFPIQLRMSAHDLQKLQDPFADKVDDKDHPQPPPSQEVILYCMTDIHNEIHSVASIKIAVAQVKQVMNNDLQYQGIPLQVGN